MVRPHPVRPAARRISMAMTAPIRVSPPACGGSGSRGTREPRGVSTPTVSRFVTHRVVTLLLCLLLAPFLTTSAGAQDAIDFAAPPPVIDLGPSLIRERISEPNDINGSWFTISVQNRQATFVTRVLTAFSSPGA